MVRLVVPLLAGAIRHAERVALAMDARAFGAHPDRTERTISRWRRRDTVFVIAFWVAGAARVLVGPAGGARRSHQRSDGGRPVSRRTRVSTRLLLCVAAIGVAGGLVNIGNAYFFNAIAAMVPALAGLGTGVYLLPAIVAQAALRRGGVGILAAMIAGFVQAPFVPGGFGTLFTYLVIGIVFELSFAVTGYRVWKTWMHYLATALIAASYSVFWAGYWDLASMQLWVQVTLPLTLFATGFAFTWLGIAIARGLERTGVLRGLARRPQEPATTTPIPIPERTPDGQDA